MSINEQLKDKLINNNLTESSVNLYLRNIKKLNDDNEVKNFKFLEDIESIKNKISKYKDNTQRAYLISIVSVLNCYKTIKKYESLYKKYYKLMRDKADEIKQKPTEDMSDKQKEHWISLDDLKGKLNKLKDDIDMFKNNKSINENSYNKLLKYLIGNLYILNSPRRNADYQYMKILINDDDKDDKDFNFLDLRKGEFIFNKYKTQKKYGQQVIKINPELLDIIKLYLKFRPGTKDNYFLVDFNNKPLLTVNSITRILNGINKGLGSSLIRHIYITDKFGNVEKEQEDVAYKMGHSKMTQLDYIKNDNI